MNPNKDYRVSCKKASYLPLHFALQVFPQTIIGTPITIEANTQIPKNVNVQP